MTVSDKEFLKAAAFLWLFSVFGVCAPVGGRGTSSCRRGTQLLLGQEGGDPLSLAFFSASPLSEVT